LEINGFEVDYQDASSSSTITYLQPENITLNLKNGIQLLITFSWQLTADVPNTTEAKIAQKIYFKLVPAEERELNDFISVAYKITTLLCFALDQTVCIEHVTATSDNICEDMGEGKTRSVPIEVYFRSIPYSKDEPKIAHMLFGYKQIQNDAERIINNWIDAYDQKC
jgi:ApeA N-terminal domain 1